jgi:hypothetical protein
VYPELIQRAMYAALPPVQRAHLWHEQLARFLSPDSPLTNEQRQWLEQIDLRLDSIFALPDMERRAALKGTLESARTVMAKPLMMQILAHLSSIPTRRAAYAAPSDAQNGTVASSRAGKSHFCNCYTGAGSGPSYDCGDLGYCMVEGSSNCDDVPIPVLCGPFQEFACDGFCI